MDSKTLELHKRIAKLEGIIEGKQLAIDMIQELIKAIEVKQPNYYSPGIYVDPTSIQSYGTNPVWKNITKPRVYSDTNDTYFVGDTNVVSKVTGTEIVDSLSSFLHK